MTGSVLRAAAAAKASRNTFYCLRASDPRFREAWDQALERGLDPLEDSLFERGAAGDTTAAIFLLKKRRPHIYGDQPKTVNQNLNVRSSRAFKANHRPARLARPSTRLCNAFCLRRGARPGGDIDDPVADCRKGSRGCPRLAGGLAQLCS